MTQNDELEMWTKEGKQKKEQLNDINTLPYKKTNISFLVSQAEPTFLSPSRA